MEWTRIIGEAIDFIERHLAEELTAGMVAAHVYLSPFYLQKAFSLLCGCTLGEYIRRRRLTLAGHEWMRGGVTVTELAMKYGYDAPDSFTRAFTRFHGVSPAAARRTGAALKVYAPLRLTISLKGGYLMEYKIVDKAAFSLLGWAGTFRYEEAETAIPAFWQDYAAAGRNRLVRSAFGVNLDLERRGETFEYLIADVYHPARDIPAGFTVRTIPAHTWAVFPCRGPLPEALAGVNRKLFAEWLPALPDYEIAAGCCIERYDDPAGYPRGVADPAYYTELWVPVKKR